MVRRFYAKYVQILTVSVALLMLCAYAHDWKNSAGETKRQQESAFERILRTGTLRCAYIVYAPEIVKDPNTGKLSGFVVDIVDEIGRQLDLKIEWQTELGFGFQDVVEGLKSRRFDAVCSGFIESPAHARAALFSVPIDFGEEYPYVRATDTRYDNKEVGVFNDPGVKISLIDGEGGALLARQYFPQASIHSLPEHSDTSESLEAVATGKADVAFYPIATGKPYLQHNPGKLKVLRHMPTGTWIQPIMAFAHGEHDFKYMIDATIRTLQNNGFIEKIFRKYDPNLESYLLPVRPYAR